MGGCGSMKVQLMLAVLFSGSGFLFEKLFSLFVRRVEFDTALCIFL